MQTLTIKEYQSLYEQAKWRRYNGLIKQGKWLYRDIKKDGVFCGCMHGSVTQSSYNVIKESSRVTGFPLWLSHLTEKIFEGLSYNDAQVFPEQIFKAFIDNPKVCGISHDDFYKEIRVKTDVARIDRLIALQEKSTYAKKDEIITALKEVKRRWIEGGTAAEWSARTAAKSAESASWSAARSL